MEGALAGQGLPFSSKPPLDVDFICLEDLLNLAFISLEDLLNLAHGSENPSFAIWLANKTFVSNAT